MRNYSVVRRVPNIVDVTTPLQDGVEAYRFSTATNFDGSFTDRVDVSRSVGWLDPNIIRAGKRDTLSVLPNRDIARFTFDPVSFSLVDDDQFWMRMTPISGGSAGTPGAMGLILPSLSHKSLGRFNIAGTAPDVAAASALVLELPRGMQDFVITVSTGSDLAVAFDETEPEIIIPTGTTQVFKDANQPRLIVRGVGGTSTFQASFFNAVAV